MVRLGTAFRKRAVCCQFSGSRINAAAIQSGFIIGNAGAGARADFVGVDAHITITHIHATAAATCGCVMLDGGTQHGDRPIIHINAAA